MFENTNFNIMKKGLLVFSILIALSKYPMKLEMKTPFLIATLSASSLDVIYNFGGLFIPGKHT